MIQGGSFSMGSKDSEQGHDANEEPQHIVRVGSFYVGKFEVTQKEWNACVAEKGCQANRNNQGEVNDEVPVVMVSWRDAQEYVAWLSNKTAKDYRLLSESEWEFAARGGNEDPYHFGAYSYKLENFAWYQGNSYGQPHRRAGKTANQYGLYDMYGNVSEWTSTSAYGHLYNSNTTILNTNGQLIPNPYQQPNVFDLRGYLVDETALQSHFAIKGGSWTQEFHYFLLLFNRKI
jgi:formylglycine-generating enzyme required for sulfatase activity